MNVIQIIKAALIEGGRDGLVNPDAECGCLLSDLAPCCDNIADCRPAYKGAGAGFDFVMFEDKEWARDSLIDTELTDDE